jgi:hypothetical protein
MTDAGPGGELEEEEAWGDIHVDTKK